MIGNLRLFEEYWEQQPNRSVLLVKWAPLTVMGGACPMFDVDINEYTYTVHGDAQLRGSVMALPPGETVLFDRDVIPPALRKAGVSKLRWATLFMHRPWCMWRASSHSDGESNTGKLSHVSEWRLARGDTEYSIRSWAKRELAHIEGLVLQHQSLEQRGAAVVVVNLAHLVYDFGGFSARLRAFAPCLGERLDDAFEPTLGTDIFLANQIKTGGTLRAYADAHLPHKLALDARTFTCNEPPEKLYEGLNETEIIRAQAAEGYLLKLSEATPSTLRGAQAVAEAARQKKLRSAQDILDALEMTKVMEYKQKVLEDKQARDEMKQKKLEKKEQYILKQAAKRADPQATSPEANPGLQTWETKLEDAKKESNAGEEKLQDEIATMMKEIEAKAKPVTM
jgi:hypothetical protein